MRMNDAYPSKYLKADADVPEEGFLVLTIKTVEMEEIGQGTDAQDKPVIYFRETQKGLVLNKTNWGLIAKALGSDDTDTWEKRKIALYSTDVQFGKDMTRGIRVNSKAPKSAASAPKATAPVVAGDPDDPDDPDDPISF